ncbi:iron-sulfur cluster assembly protein, partial [Microbacterium sp. PF5]
MTGTAAGSRAEAWRIAAAVPDPEVPVLTIEDLGVLRAVEVHGDTVRVDITPTYSGCPAMDTIRDDVVL